MFLHLRQVSPSINYVAGRTAKEKKMVTNYSSVQGKYHVKDKKNYKKRKCLSCGDMFPSEWIGNRVCDKCTGTMTSKRSRKALSNHLWGKN